MKLNIPFQKDVKFTTPVADVLSISLEHDYTVNDKEILGNFTVFGDYKTHEVSVDKKRFEFVLPFSVNIEDRIDKDSIDLEIDNFTYSLKKDDTLSVNIDYIITGEEKNIIFEKPEETSLEDIITEIDREENEKENTPADTKEENQEEREVLEETKENIITEIKDEEESFVTYHVHVVKEVDTVESICHKYNITQMLLGSYNDLNSFKPGEKLIIPEEDE